MESRRKMCVCARKSTTLKERCEGVCANKVDIHTNKTGCHQALLRYRQKKKKNTPLIITII